jgi:putative peptidoglycan binding protein
MRWLVLLVFAGLASCHAHEAVSPAEESPPSPLRINSPRPVATTPEGLIKPGGIAKMQRALREKGLDAPQTDKLDEQTKSALLDFQKREKLPATGLPDYVTVRKLGLDPNDIFTRHKASR